MLIFLLPLPAISSMYFRSMIETFRVVYVIIDVIPPLPRADSTRSSFALPTQPLSRAKTERGISRRVGQRVGAYRRLCMGKAATSGFTATRAGMRKRRDMIQTATGRTHKI